MNTISNRKISIKIFNHIPYYIFILPGFILLFLFAYLPMFGVVMAFQKYDPVSGFLRSEWVGLENFLLIFRLPDFLRAFKNTLFISCLKLLFCFPAPIIFALLINEIKSSKFKRTVQSISYLPNFISWVVVAGFVYQIFSPDTGVVNLALRSLGIVKEPIYFMQSKVLFYPIVIISDLWKNVGFSSIIYLAAIASIEQEQYEAAFIDGAGRFKQALYVTLPNIKNTVILLFILAVSGILNAGFDQLWTLSNNAVRDSAEILDTLAMRYLMRGRITDLSTGAAMGFFKSFVGALLFFVCNWLSKKYNNESLV